MVTGDQDCLVGEASRAELRALANPVLDVAVVAGADHYVRQSAADAFHAVVDPWLEQHV